MEYVMEVIGALLTVISTYIGVTVSTIKSETKTMSKAITEINGSVKGLKVWAEGHEKLDDERFHHLDQSISKI